MQFRIEQQSKEASRLKITHCSIQRLIFKAQRVNSQTIKTLILKIQAVCCYPIVRVEESMKAKCITVLSTSIKVNKAGAQKD